MSTSSASKIEFLNSATEKTRRAKSLSYQFHNLNKPSAPILSGIESDVVESLKYFIYDQYLCFCFKERKENSFCFVVGLIFSFIA